jgi:hypothetical protein
MYGTFGQYLQKQKKLEGKNYFCFHRESHGRKEQLPDPDP